MMNLDRRNFLSKSLAGVAVASFGVSGVDIALGGEQSSREEAKAGRGELKEVYYKDAIIKKYPEQLIIVIAKDKNGKANPMPMGWSMITSSYPPMMAISMGQGRYTAEAIKHSKCFTIAYPASDMADAVLFYGTNSGRDIDKFAEFDIPRQQAKRIDSVLLTGAVANFECELAGEFITGTHTIFAGRIIASHINTAPKQRLFIVGPGKQLAAVQTKE